MGSERPADAIGGNAGSSVSKTSVIGDNPTAEPGLGFQDYAEAIADAVRGGESPQFTVGLYGPWGSGKTSLLRAIERILSQDTHTIPVFFDAWRYERSEHIIVPLLHSVYAIVDEHRGAGDKVTDHLKRALKSTIYGLSIKIGTPGAGVGLSAKDVADKWKSEGLPDLDEAFARPFSELRELWDHLKPTRIVVLIDDLDRCSPEKVVSVLESINLVMDVDGFIFVLALDYDVLVSAINTKYTHVSGDDFVQKIIQLPFRVPELSLERPETLAELIRNWEEWTDELPEDLPDHLLNISKLGLASNPRQIKRLINSFLLLHKLFGPNASDSDLKFLATLLGIQLRWPQRFRDFQRATSSTDDSEKWELRYYFQKRDEEYPDLWRYAERLLPRTMDLDDIWRVLRLTRAVALDKESPSGTMLYDDSGNLRESGTSNH